MNPRKIPLPTLATCPWWEIITCSEASTDTLMKSDESRCYLLIPTVFSCQRELLQDQGDLGIKVHLCQCSETTYFFLSHLINTFCRPTCILNMEVPNTDRDQELFYHLWRKSMGGWEKERIKHWTSAGAILPVGKVAFLLCFSLLPFQILGHCNKKQRTMQKKKKHIHSAPVALQPHPLHFPQ